LSQLIGIAIRQKKRAPMELLDSAFVTTEKGIVNDFRGKPGNRQVTVLSKTAWNTACDELGQMLDWQIRRANLLVDDIDLQEKTGKIIRIGEIQLKITQETDPCKRMEELVAGLFKALAKQWRGGVCCRVISEGQIKIGDKVEII